ncbi:unnamed protein product [Dovyalis caffra]|uniref:DUF7812 domain-containing protein n=1 Tax=Dovyalis caffra TaxID=77055 RepID=A0AAV1RSQ3_9ROSI|nr:unnamed protein product [Dovyalis caffra]
MAAKKPKRKIKHLISAIQSPQGLNPPNLKRLYALLHHLSTLDSPISGSFPHRKFKKCGFNFKLKDIQCLSDILFKQLEARFHGFFSALHEHNVSAADNRKCFLIGELTLLLRCCLVLLVLIEYDHLLLVEKGLAILSILSRLISIELSGGNGKSRITFKKLVSRQCVSDDCTTSITEEFVASLCLWEPSDPRYAFLRAVLEVFADELLVHQSLRQYFVIVDSAPSRSERLFACPSGHGNIGSVLEVICAHFVVSLSDEQAFENFLNGRFWCHGEDSRFPEMGLPAALSLLLNPIMLSAPKLFQAYLILMVSEAIGICMPQPNMMLDLKLMDCYTEAFETSIFLYTRHMSSLHVDDDLLGDNGSFITSGLHGSNSKLNFESLLQPATRDKLHHLISKSYDAWDSYLSNMSSKTNSELMAASIAFMKENLCIVDESYKDEVLSILSCIILRCPSDDIGDTLLLKKGKTSSQDIYLLASILKLMSSSMLQAIWYGRHLRFLGCQDVSSCKGCNVIVDILGCFEHFSINLPTQKFLCEMLQSHPARHKKTKWMFFHFSGLLSLSYSSGLDFLVKDCLFALLVVLNLFIIEEGDLTAVGSVFGSRLEFISSKSTDKFGEVMAVSKSGQIVSSKTRKIQEMCLRTRSIVCSNDRKQHNQVGTSEHASIMNEVDSAVSTEDAKETCNGEIFLKCVLGKYAKSDDMDDLSDFIECEQGKNYSGWLRDRQRFRIWKYKKTIIRRWKKKKMSWNHLKGLVISNSAKTEIISNSTETVGIVSKDLKILFKFESDQIPNCLKQISKVARSNEFFDALVTLTQALTGGILHGYRTNVGIHHDFSANGNAGPSFLHKIFDKLPYPPGSGFVSIVVGSFARNLVVGFHEVV